MAYEGDVLCQVVWTIYDSMEDITSFKGVLVEVLVRHKSRLVLLSIKCPPAWISDLIDIV